MRHLNGHILCAIDTETTGLDPVVHEMIEIAIVPLGPDLKPRKDIFPFNFKIRPENVNVIDKEALSVNKITLEDLYTNGIDPIKASDLFETWFDNLKLPFGKKIVPLGHNWSFDAKFIEKWLGLTAFNCFFDYHYRDSSAIALFLNDWAEFHNERHPFPKVKLSYLCSQLKVENQRAHRALDDAIATAECYRRLVLQAPYMSV